MARASSVNGAAFASARCISVDKRTEGLRETEGYQKDTALRRRMSMAVGKGYG